MINNVLDATTKAKATIKEHLLVNYYSVGCAFKKNGKAVSGEIIHHKNANGVDTLDTIRPDVMVRSHTGKEYPVLLCNILSIDGLDEI